MGSQQAISHNPTFPLLRVLEAKATPPVDQSIAMMSNFEVFLEDRERLMCPECAVRLTFQGDVLVALPFWDLPSVPHLKLSELAKIERRISAQVRLRREANAMHWIYKAEALRAYRVAAMAFYAGQISSEDLANVGVRLSEEERRAICIEMSPLGGAA